MPLIEDRAKPHLGGVADPPPPGDDHERLLRDRVTQLGLARTEVHVPVDATITPRTLALDTMDATFPHGGAGSGASTDIDLPRIAIDGRERPTSSGLRSDFAIVSTLGEGGMGRVHLARQRSLDRDVAVKTLKPGAPPAISHALLREARLTGSLEHPGVIPVHALGVDELGRPMLIMKRVDGVDLGALLVDPRHAAWRDKSADRLVASLEILTQVCLTLEFAHSRGVIHRDIKPENVMIGGFGEVYLLDWGIATEKSNPVDARALVGTPVYMAPEMVLGQAVDERTDVYLLGATLHEILTGKRRHEGATIVDALRAAVLSVPVDYGAAVPEQLARLCNRATARDPAMRLGSVREVRDEIADFVRHRGARALSDAALERLTLLERELASAQGAPEDLARAYRLATEARFGLTQSLREHAADGVARERMRRCLASSIELELRQDHADTADALLREMDPPDADIARRIGESRERTAMRARERERLKMLDRDLDPTEHARIRNIPLAVIALLLVGVGSIIAVRGGELTPESAAVVGALATVVVAAIILVLRRRVLTNAFNRRVGALLILGLASVFVHRLFGVLTHTPVPQTAAVDLLIFAVVIGATAITMMPRLGACAVLPLAGAVATYEWPHQAAAIFGVALLGAVLVGATILARARRPGEEKKE